MISLKLQSLPVRRALLLSVLVSMMLFCFTDGVAAARIGTSALLRSAKKDFLSGDFSRASLKFQNLLERTLDYPQLKEALLSLCESRLREGKLAEAESVAVIAMQKLSDVAGLERVGFLKAEILYFSGRMEEALEAYIDFLETNPESPLANDVIERLLLIDENGDYGLVPLTAFSRADFLQFAGMADSALTLLDELLSGFPDADIADDALMKKGDIHNFEGRFLEAVAEYALMETRFPESHLVPVCKLKMAELYATELEQKDKAIAQYEDVVTAFPGTSFAVEARGLLQNLKKDSDKP